jgi:HK97 family phage portal protein
MGILTGIFESRTHPSMDADWGRIFGGGLETAAGVDVTIEGSLKLPAVWSCVRVLSETIASLPLFVYERMERGKRRAPEHLLYELLHVQPNPEQTAFGFFQLMVSHCALWGNAYAQVVRSNAGRVLELWPLRPDRMRVLRRDGELLYVYMMTDGQPDVTLRAWEVLHFRGLSGDGIVGYSPVREEMQALGLGLATEEYGARFFGNGARPGMVYQHPGTLSEDAYKRLKASLERDHGGLSQAHRIKILEEGMTAEVVSVPPEEAQFLQTRQFQAQEIARIFRMPPHKIGLLEDATFSNIEHQAIEFVTDTIRPWLVNFEQTMKQQLLTPVERKRYFTEFMVEGLLRGDTASRYAAYATGRQNGWLSVNDIRELENMDAIEGGDEYLVPLNMVEAGEEVDSRLRGNDSEVSDG